MTPYQVAKKLGFPAHSSQQKGWGWYFSGYNTAAAIKDYSPCKYGLYRTTVGPDIEKNDMFENLLAHTASVPEIPETEPPIPETVPTSPETETAVTEFPLTAVTEPAPSVESTFVQETPTEDLPAAEPGQNGLMNWLIIDAFLCLILIILLILKRKQRRRN